MDEPDVDYFRALLRERRDALSSVIESGEEAARPVELDQTRVGRLSRMDAMQAQAMAKESDRRRHVEIRRIDAALGRIDDEDYGYCLSCGDAIAAPRLEVDPAATRCLKCAESAER